MPVLLRSSVLRSSTGWATTSGVAPAGQASVIVAALGLMVSLVLVFAQ
jgi:hypothetical protein